MTKQLTVSQVYEVEGVKAFVFSNGSVMALVNGRREFLNCHGRGLSAAPSSRYYPLCYEMQQAAKQVAA